MLAPAGLLAAIAAVDAPAAALLVLPLVELLPGFAARARRARRSRSIELGRAYRGTALLLRDLLEEDDEYTGHHTQDVVELSLRVAEQLGVSEDVRRDTELGALLHDIGKIAIPDAIINKPGQLDDEEWALMKTHTIVGQQMLDRVGGLLGSVGLVVRASHERFDGRGYPDGLIGCEIPLAARIIIACDSFNAMTTTRPYRPAMPLDEAVDRDAALLGHAVRPERGRRAARSGRRSGLAADAARAVRVPASTPCSVPNRHAAGIHARPAAHRGLAGPDRHGPARADRHAGAPAGQAARRAAFPEGGRRATAPRPATTCSRWTSR